VLANQFTKTLLQEYELIFPPQYSHAYAPCEWQCSVSAFAYAIVSTAPANQRHIWTTLATGCGKSVIIAGLVYLLRRYPPVQDGQQLFKHIVLSSSTPLLTRDLRTRYIPVTVLPAPSGAAREVVAVYHMHHNHMWNRYVKNKASATILIVDEYDATAAWHRLKVDDKEDGKIRLIDSEQIAPRFTAVCAWSAHLPTNAQGLLEVPYHQLHLGNARNAGGPVFEHNIHVLDNLPAQNGAALIAALDTVHAAHPSKNLFVICPHTWKE